MNSSIKGILIDYGGTIDTNGIHWSEVIFEGYYACGISISKADFRKAYVYGEQSLERHQHLIKPEYTFGDLMRLKLEYHREYISAHFSEVPMSSEQAMQAADYCYRYARRVVGEQSKTLAALAKKLPIVLVSNFYGNLTSVLRDFGITPYFRSVVESSVVGVRKPDPEIFRIGAQRLELEPSECVIIGDSYGNDIVPAKQLGCKSVWLKGIGWDADDMSAAKPQPDYTIHKLEEVINMFDNLK